MDLHFLLFFAHFVSRNDFSDDCHMIILGERSTAILSKRIAHTKGRIYRIKVLRRINARAAKLVNTGAMPQATHGKEACGLSMEAVHRL